MIEADAGAEQMPKETKDQRDLRMIQSGRRVALHESFDQRLTRLVREHWDEMGTDAEVLMVSVSDYSTFRRDAGSTFIPVQNALSVVRTGTAGRLRVAGRELQVIVSTHVGHGTLVLTS